MGKKIILLLFMGLSFALFDAFQIPVAEAVGKKPPEAGGGNAAPAGGGNQGVPNATGGTHANNPPAPSGGSNPADNWSPEQMKGTVWDEVPQGGALRPEADGSYTILDKDMKVVKVIPPPGTTPMVGTGGNNPPPTPPTPPGNPMPSAPQPLPPIVTPTPGGGTISSTQNPDGTWSHHYHRDDPDGSVDTDLKPGDDSYPHDDPRFWAPAQSSSGRVVTKTSGGGTITSTRNPDGNWSHQYHRESDMGTVDYPLKPGDSLYPDDDPRFQNPNAPPPPPALPALPQPLLHPRDENAGGGTSMNFPEGQGFGGEMAEGIVERPAEPHHDGGHDS